MDAKLVYLGRSIISLSLINIQTLIENKLMALARQAKFSTISLKIFGMSISHQMSVHAQSISNSSIQVLCWN
jgi:hypothetical protein